MNKLLRRNLRTLVGARAGLVGGLWIAVSVALGGCASQPHGAPALPPAPTPTTAAARPAAPATSTVTQSTASADLTSVPLRGNRSMDTGFMLKRKGSRKLVLPEETGEADLMLPGRTPATLTDNTSGDRGDGARGGAPDRGEAS